MTYINIIMIISVNNQVIQPTYSCYYITSYFQNILVQVCYTTLYLLESEI
jgi:hypothetical protein